jgi:hypothetical protein
MKKPLNYLALLALLLGSTATPVLAQGKGSRSRGEESSGNKTDRNQGGEAAPERTSRSQSRRGGKAADGRGGASSDRGPETANKRRR